MKLSVGATALLCTFAVAQTTPFDAREATVASVHGALFTRQNSCRDIVSAFLARIEGYNPYINALVTLNQDALDDADQLDLSLSVGNATGSLFCIPVLLKDNYDAAGLPTTGGSVTLNASIPATDSPSVAALRNAGAIILGKANLHEFALEGLSVSTVAGQTINPYDFSRTPGGSSGGTGAAIAASFAVFGTGKAVPSTIVMQQLTLRRLRHCQFASESSQCQQPLQLSSNLRSDLQSRRHPSLMGSRHHWSHWSLIA